MAGRRAPTLLLLYSLERGEQAARRFPPQLSSPASQPPCPCAPSAHRAPARRTQLASRTSELLLVEAQPVRKLVVSSAGDSVWVATSSSSLNQWALDPALPAAAVGGTTPRMQQAQQAQQQAQQQQQQQAQPPWGRTFVPPPSAVQRGRMAFEGGACVAAERPTCASFPPQSRPGPLDSREVLFSSTAL